MKDLQWFPPIPEPRRAAFWRTLAVLIPVVALLDLSGHRRLAIGAASLGILVLALSAIPVWGLRIARLTRGLAQAIGRVVTLVLLWPFYVLVFGAVRLVLSLARIDLLGLKLQPDLPSYWQSAPPEEKRARYYDRLFTVEPTRGKAHPRAWAIGIVLFALVLGGSSELILRIMGFGSPIVYRVDPQIGYYPAPHQDVRRYGGEIQINAFGMRSPDVTVQKPAGTFRILMLGDSTLYGGSYIGQDQLYASHLQTLLNQNTGALPHSPQHVEVLAMGVNGWGPQHEAAYVQEFGIFEADLVMVMGPPNDAYRPRYGIEQMPFYAEGHGPHLAWEEFWDHLKWERRARQSGGEAGFSSGPHAGEVLAEGVAAWLAIADTARARGAGMDFELLPNEDEVREGKAADTTQRVLDALQPELARRGIAVAYPIPFLQSKLSIAGLYHDGVHLGVAGHDIYAQYLSNRVRQVASAN